MLSVTIKLTQTQTKNNSKAKGVGIFLVLLGVVIVFGNIASYYSQMNEKQKELDRFEQQIQAGNYDSFDEAKFYHELDAIKAQNFWLTIFGSLFVLVGSIVIKRA